MVFRISDEKDARGYLQVLAAKMKEELEYLKQCPNNNGQSALVRIIFYILNFDLFAQFKKMYSLQYLFLIYYFD